MYFVTTQVLHGRLVKKMTVSLMEPINGAITQLQLVNNFITFLNNQKHSKTGNIVHWVMLLYCHLYTAILHHFIPPCYRTDDVAKAFLQLVEEDHHNQAVYVPAEGKDVVFVEDDTIRFAKEVLGLDYGPSQP